MDYVYSTAAALLAYLLGSLSFAVIVSRVMGLKDPRSSCYALAALKLKENGKQVPQKSSKSYSGHRAVFKPIVFAKPLDQHHW